MMRSRERGFGILGLMGMILLVGTLCAAAAMASTRSAAGSIKGVQRLQIQAAAEGAAVMIRQEAMTSGTLEIGECRVAVSPAADGSTQSLHMIVDLQSGPRTVHSRRYQAHVYDDRTIVEKMP